MCYRSFMTEFFIARQPFLRKHQLLQLALQRLSPLFVTHPWSEKVLDIEEFEPRSFQKHVIVVFLSHLDFSVDVFSNPFHKLLLDHVQVIFPDVKPNHCYLIHPLTPSFLIAFRKHFKVVRFWIHFHDFFQDESAPPL